MQWKHGSINKFVLLLRKCVYPYEYMDSWERFNDTSLPDDEKAFYSKLNLEDITNEDYAHAKNLGDHHDLYVQCDLLLLGCI